MLNPHPKWTALFAVMKQQTLLAVAAAQRKVARTAFSPM